MDYEKAYKEALERAREFQKSKDGLCVLTAESIFPELKESEDEKIRKALIELFTATSKKDWRDIPTEKILAWLEKQGEQKPTEKQKEINYAEEIKKCKDNPLYFFDKYVNIKLKEQKPIIVKPKFKIRDWITDGEAVFHITSYDIDYGYQLKTQKGTSFHFSDEKVKNKYHLWTIQDAKDGDVLVDVYGNIGIFQKNDDFDWSSYCSLGSNGGFRCFAIEHELDGSHPATKEQRDTLFKAMTEAGYQWDAEKKELKKIEDEIEIHFGAKDSELQEVTYYIPKGFHAEIDDDEVVIKKGDKPTWSDEDEENLQHCCGAVFAADYYTYEDKQDMEKWLLQLKERLS